MGYDQAAIFGAALSFPVVGLLLVAVRFWMRLSLQKTKIGLDDWSILFASVLVIVGRISRRNVDAFVVAIVLVTGTHDACNMKDSWG